MTLVSTSERRSGLRQMLEERSGGGRDRSVAPPAVPDPGFGLDRTGVWSRQDRGVVWTRWVKSRDPVT